MSIEILYTLPIAFLAGFIDAIAGGGGLIQIPGLLFLFPQAPIASLLGTNKFASFFGTAFSSAHYARTLKINLSALLPAILGAFLFAMLGAKASTLISNQILRPLIFGLLLLMGIYTLFHKQFGVTTHKNLSYDFKLKLQCGLIGATLGFYDGFFGPGTGSLLIFCFVSWLGFNFLEGSAFAKFTNLASNLAAMIYFASTQHIMYTLAIPMAIANILGNILGARLAVKKGSQFVRWVFLGVVIMTLMQFMYQMNW